MTKIIPIVYASDENFLPQTYVSICSVLTNRKEDYFIRFYILVPEECRVGQYDDKWDFKQYDIELAKLILDDCESIGLFGKSSDFNSSICQKFINSNNNINTKNIF